MSTRTPTTSPSLAVDEAERLGATPRPDGSCRFRVWAPNAQRVALRIEGSPPRRVVLEPVGRGYHAAIVSDVPPGTLYQVSLDNGDPRPDPASRAQPQGVHGPSAVVDPGFGWRAEGWINPPLAQHVFYELHVGTFTPQGTFDAIIERLDDLVDLGVTTIELMPVAAFPGDRNWGYDGVCLYAAHTAYGGVDGLRRLVDAAHERGLAVALDVVYNHLGPEGNYLGEFGPYFTDHYHTPWGDALNFDGAGADGVREFFIQNALWWTLECGIDVLRLDAVHAIIDGSALPFIEELAERVQSAAASRGRRVHLIAESAANDARQLRPRAGGGAGLDGQWNDDFHHAVHTVLTGEHDGYYAAYGELQQLGRAMTDGYVYTGQHSPWYGRRHGRPATGIPAWRFVVFAQNHDQIGNRMLGERLSSLVDPGACRLAAALVLLSPFVPLLFMGEEHGDPAPFLYFISHGDPDLVEAVRRGRAEEFAAFGWTQPPPDPQDPATFERSRIDWSLRTHPNHAPLLAFHRRLLELRRSVPALANLDTGCTSVEVRARQSLLIMHRWSETSRALALFNVGGEPAEATVDLEPDGWRLAVDTSAAEWGGPGSGAPPTPEPALRIAQRSALLYIHGEG